MRKILVIVGSGIKNGNTDKLADAYIKGAEAAGHEITKVFLGDKEIAGCRGCGACQNGKHICAIDDVMQEIYPLLEKCDTVVLASPLYFWSISARTKAFIDRLYAISTDDKYPHKNSVLLMTAEMISFGHLNSSILLSFCYKSDWLDRHRNVFCRRL